MPLPKPNSRLQEGMWTRFFPAVEHARSLIEAGAVGAIVAVQVRGEG